MIGIIALITVMNDSRDISNTSMVFYTSRNALVVLLLCLSVLFTYANSFRNGFVEDDHYIIELNQDSLSLQGAVAAFTSEDKLVATDSTPYYRPLTRFSFLIDQHYFGLKPAGYHAVNILLHVICTVLLFFTLLRLECGFAASFGVSLLFGVHPVNAEAVNFISGRNNILAAIFVLGSTLTFLNAEGNRRTRGYILSGFFFFLGILCKETALMLIPFLIFLKIYKERSWRGIRSILKWDTKFILFHVIYLGVYIHLRLYAIDSGSMNMNLSGMVGRLRDLIYIIPEYFSLAVIPIGLTFLHRVPMDYNSVLTSLLFKWFILLAFLTYLVRNRTWIIGVGFAWLIINSVPISNIVPIPSASFAERYMYLPMIGFLIIVADVITRVSAKNGSHKLPLLVFSFFALILGTVTFNKNFDWRDNLALIKNIVDTNPSYALGHFEFGYESFLRGDNTTAEKEFKRALALDSHLPQATWIRYYLGALSVESHKMKNAERYFLDATRSDPHNSTAQYALARLLAAKGSKTSLKAYDEFIAATLLTDYHLLIEVRNSSAELDHSQKNTIPRSPLLWSVPPALDTWKLVHEYPSGTQLFYDSAHLQKKNDDIIVIMKQLLSKLDRRVYGLRIIRFPLKSMTEAQFAFHIKCRQNILKMEYMEFKDCEGNTLGKILPEKEFPEMNDYTPIYSYLLPYTIMRSFSDKICGNP